MGKPGTAIRPALAIFIASLLALLTTAGFAFAEPAEAHGSHLSAPKNGASAPAAETTAKAALEGGAKGEVGPETCHLRRAVRTSAGPPTPPDPRAYCVCCRTAPVDQHDSAVPLGHAHATSPQRIGQIPLTLCVFRC
ncbi:hypothetical protein C3486_22850 [Streptomyces sp. Ru73]|uniref:hypothetical protein n=1 Tax=Streptomyces sp. Ru73 TaxID=2080748 RepID=UPI000CDD8810|nr:hypothetical protein [Streptomyces sp. Ru73]POX38467.1 hypothetical protein C3486_22850 [Streptomyces sp. Ru73]